MSHVFVVVCADGSLLVWVCCCSCQRRGGLGSVFCSSSAAHPNVAATHRPARPLSDNMGLAVYTALGHAYRVSVSIALRRPCVCSGRLGRHVAATFGCAADEEQNMLSQAADAHATAPSPKEKSYLDVGMTNSAPLPMLSGQRCMTLFCLV